MNFHSRPSGPASGNSQQDFQFTIIRPNLTALIHKYGLCNSKKRTNYKMLEILKWIHEVTFLDLKCRVE